MSVFWMDAGGPFPSEINHGDGTADSPTDFVLLTSTLAEDRRLLKERGIL